MVEEPLFSVLSKLQPSHILVIGDLMLDRYTKGQMKRISPEAPIGVFNSESEESRLGGTGNVILNLLSLGAKVTPISRVGDDEVGREILRELKAHQLCREHIFVQKGYQSSMKNRLIANHQQVLRIDSESLHPLQAEIEEIILERLPQILNDVDLIAISDYGKGMLSSSLLQSLIGYANERKIPTIVDPKGIDFTKYSDAHLIKPNLSEAFAAAKMPKTTPLHLVAEELFRQTQSRQIVITRSDEGISLFHRSGKEMQFPVQSKEVRDVTGAGDTVLAMICLSLASALPIEDGLRLANIAAGIAIEKIGCAQISLSQIAQRLFELNPDNKIFDENHTFALKKRLSCKKVVMLLFNEKEEFSIALYQQLKKIKLRYKEHLIGVVVFEQALSKQTIELFSSLKEVDFIVLLKEKLSTFFDEVVFDKVYRCTEGMLVRLHNPEEIAIATHRHHS